MKKILLLGFSLLLYSFNYGQTSDGEIVISEEHIQRLADKLYELKIERNKAEKISTKNLDEELEIRYLKSIIESDTSNKDSLRFLIEKMMISDEFVEGFSSAYYSESEAEAKSTSIQSDDAQQILERLAAIEEQLKKNNLSENETIVVQQAGNNQKEDVYITNVQEKNAPNILAVQRQQNDALAETNSKLDSLLKLVGSPKKDSLKATKTYLAEEDTAQNKQTIESLKTQIYLLHAKLDRVLEIKLKLKPKKK